MTSALYLILSFVLVSPAFGARYTRQASTCPLIHAKDAGDCQGEISECWSPGSLDVDCENGAGVCCFNGCVNVCGVPKVCEIVYETRFENVTTEVCNPEEQAPVCTTQTFEDCWDNCHTVNDPVCQTSQSQVCDSPNASPAAQTCPVIHLKPSWECTNEQPSDCWSPGVLDLDCENGAGLCCFNGCYNRCLKNCRFEEHEVCGDTYQVDKCEDVPSQECFDVSAPITVPMKTTTCTKMESACMSMPRTFCQGDEFDNCFTSEVQQCSEEGREECTTSVTYVNKQLVFNKCNVVHKNVCVKIPKRDCHTERKEVCPECRTVSTEKCEDVPRNVCEKVCQPRYEESCTQPEPIQVCKPVVKFNSFQVPVSKCS